MGLKLNDYPNYDKWFEEVKRIAKILEWPDKAINSICKDSWKDYWEEGMTPTEAWLEEYRN